MDDKHTLSAPRSQTPFGNALARPGSQPPLVPDAAASEGETLFRMEGVSGSPSHHPPLVPSASSAGGSAAPPADTPPWETEFPSQGIPKQSLGTRTVSRSDY